MLFDPSNISKEEHQTFLTAILEQGLYQINNFKNCAGNVLDTVFTNVVNDFTIELATETLTNKTSIYHEIFNITYYYDAIVNENNNIKTTNFIYDFTKANYDMINDEIKKINFPENLQDPNDIAHFFNVSLLDIINVYVPKKAVKVLTCPPHFNKYLRKLRNERNRYYKKFKKSKNAEHYDKWFNLSNRFRIEEERLNCEHKSFLISKIKDDPKQFWNYINHKRKNNNYPILMKFNDKESCKDSEISNLFKQFFQSVYQEPINFDTNNFDHLTAIQDPLDAISITKKEIKTAIKKLDKNKGPGPDLIPPRFLFNTVDTISEKLYLIFKTSLDKGIFPDSWKNSFITPIFKSGNKSDIKNYRGIAILSCIPKLFESIVTNKISSHLSGFITSKQHGFTKRRSTVTNLSVYTSYIRNEMANKRQIDAIYTDFQKAFDRVDHKLLIFKLNKIGFNGNILNWLSSYLTNRTQVVKFKNSFSEEVNVTSGVPQGSHLGPILFNLFINDLSLLLPNCECLFYADDLKLFKAICMPSDTNLIQTDLNSLNLWCSHNGMQLNVKKCNVITFSKLNCTTVNPYKIGNDTLERVKLVRDLGVMLDEKLNFNHHIDKISNGSMSMLGFIKRRTYEFNDPYVARTLYLSLVRPLLENACTIWSPSYDTYSNRIESVQKQFLLFSLRNLGWSSYRLPKYEHRLLLLNLITLKMRRELFDCMYIFDLLRNNIDCSVLGNRISINENRRDLRHTRFLTEYFSRNNYTFNDTTNRAIRNFNKLSHFYNDTISRDSFKNKIIDELKYKMRST